MEKKTLIISIAVALVVLVGVSYLAYQQGYRVGYEQGKETGMAAAKTEAGTAVTNPMEKMPETNPFENVANPFKDLYQNPFK